MDQYFPVMLRMPLQAILAIDGPGIAIGLVELSIRSYGEECLTDGR